MEDAPTYTLENDLPNAKQGHDLPDSFNVASLPPALQRYVVFAERGNEQRHNGQYLSAKFADYAAKMAALGVFLYIVEAAKPDTTTTTTKTKPKKK